MKKKIIEGWGALRCRLGTCVERLQRVRQVCFQRKQLKVTFFGSFWMSIVFFACFLIYPPTVGITGSSITRYTPLRSVHPFLSFFATPLRSFVCPSWLLPVCCVLTESCIPSISTVYASHLWFTSCISPLFSQFDQSKGGVLAYIIIHNHQLVSYQICVSLYLYNIYIYNMYTYVYIYIRYMCILCIHRHHFPGRWGGAQSPEGHCLHGAAFDGMGRVYQWWYSGH